MKKPSLWNLLRKVHDNEDGVISIETILIIGAIALPILIFLDREGMADDSGLLQQGYHRPASGTPIPRPRDSLNGPAADERPCWPRSCCSVWC